MGTAVLDAMALGVPPVTFDAGGAAEYIEDGKSGVVVKANDTVAFATALSSLVEDEEARETLAAFGPGRAAAFSLSRLADGTHETYRRVLAQLYGEGAGFRSA
jgi:glycosyltransferase involved in cell wall biosynthesis